MVFPDPEIVPELALHVTPILEEPVTAATNVCDPPAEMLVAFGEMVIETPASLGLEAEEDAVPLPQELSKEMVANTAAQLSQRQIPLVPE
jgi:hypothetical protein